MQLSKEQKDILLVSIITIFLTVIGWYLTERVVTQVLFGDEGLLWYNTLQTIRGKTPIADFNAYDPFRYYWTMGWMSIFGKGLVGLRLSIAFIRFISLTITVWILRQIKLSWIELTLVGAAIFFWFIPRHKLYDIAVVSAAVLVVFNYLRNPSMRNHFVLGLVLGFSAFVGRNHGLYLALAFFSAILLAQILALVSGTFRNCVLVFLAGIVVGYLPMILMFIFLPGFLTAFIDNILFLIALGATNLAIPVPWPWLVDFSQDNWIYLVRDMLTGSLFLLLPTFYILMTVYLGCKLIKQRKQGVSFLPVEWLLLSSVLVGVPYLHHAFSRADISHLSQSILPFWLGIQSMFAIRRSRNLQFSFLAILLTCTFFAQVRPTVLWDYWTVPETGTKIDILGESFWMSNGMASLLETLQKVVVENSQKGERVFLAPSLPGLYCILDMKAPTKDAYFIFFTRNIEQEMVIHDLEKEHVNFALINDFPLDDMDERRFSNSHLIIWDYLTKNFYQVDDSNLPRDYVVFKRK